MLARLSIRARITLGSVVIAAVLFVVALAVVRVQVEGILIRADTTLAREDLASFENDILTSPDESVDAPGQGVLVFVRSPAGEVQADTLPDDVREAVESRTPADEEFVLGDDEHRSFVVVGRLVTTAEGDWTLWAARNTAASGIALRGFDWVLALGGGILLIGFGIASWLLATAALRPVTRLRKEAELLGSDSSTGELPVGPARDEIAELATTLNQLISRVREGTEREKQMVSDAAHELRTPLAALKTQLELAHDSFGDASALAAEIGAAETSVERLSSLASNLLELSRLGSTAATIRSSSWSELEAELLGSIDRARMIGTAKNADITFSIEGAAEPARYAVDATSFGRLCDNLLANAIAAIADNGIVAANLTADPSGLRLDVADDGPGMPSAFLAHAFDRFSRPDDSRSSSTGGSGLGLALVRAIAESAGGTATLRNRERGLIVTITIPKM